MDLVVDRCGQVRCIYAESIDLHLMGRPTVVRASHVEPDSEGRWWADLSPVSGPKLGPFRQRTEALAAEYEWLVANWLVSHHPNCRGANVLKIAITEAELHTILAALRLYQRQIGGLGACSDWIIDVATNGGMTIALDATAIERLCERINVEASQ